MESTEVKREGILERAREAVVLRKDLENMRARINGLGIRADTELAIVRDRLDGYRHRCAMDLGRLALEEGLGIDAA